MTNNDFSKQDGVSLTKHFEVVIENLARYMESRLTGVEKSIEIAKESMDRRLIGMNEIRASMADQAANFPNKAEVKAEIDNLKREIADFHTFKEERSHLPADVAALKKDVVLLNTFRDKMDGKASTEHLLRVQKSAESAYIFGVIGVILALASLLLRLFGV